MHYRQVPLITTQAVTLRVSGLDHAVQLYVHGEQDQFVSRRIREEGVWEPYETSLLLALLQPGDVFVDVGANIGYFSVLAASVVGAEGAVFAFEPDPDNCRLLQASADLNGQQQLITVVEAGLADTQGEGHLFLSEDNLGDHQIYAADTSRDSVPIALYNGSDYLAERLDRIDLVKVDTQGSEFQVMVGLLPLLRTLPRIPRMIIELTPFSLREAGASGRALIELLATLGEPLWIIDHIEHRLVLSSAQELALWCDNVDSTHGDQGFMNILLGSAP
jgi:FkbM family methyltransferase